MNGKQSVTVLVVILTVSVMVSGCIESNQESSDEITRVGFDLDDTLIFSTPGFKEGFEREVEPFSPQFWSIVNRSDKEYSCRKPKTLALLRKHRGKGDEIFVITAREPHNEQSVRKFLRTEFKIPPENVYFEPDGKEDLLKKLKIDLYYGDSDSDIKAARGAGSKAIRIQRHPGSSYRRSYNPGRFGETVIDNSAEHDCS
ncbi:MAG: HAD family acid phosphatase [bacterium]